MSTLEVRVPDLGEVKGVTVLDVLIKKGDKVAVEDPLISLESDKAAMDVPSPVSGVINSVEIKKGDAVTSGTLIAIVEADAAAAKSVGRPAPAPAPAPASAARAAARAPAKAAASLRRARVPRLRRPVPLSPPPSPAALRPPERSTWWCWAPVSADTRPHFARLT